MSKAAPSEHVTAAGQAGVHESDEADEAGGNVTLGGSSARPHLTVTDTNTTPKTPDETAQLRDELHRRLARLERQNRWIKLSSVLFLVIAILFAARDLVPPDTIVRQTLMESKELKLLDNDGQPRLFLRMYSRVPVLQLLDANGKPRMSLGLRFDDTPFLDLSDKSGSTRASIQLGPSGEPMIELFEENGESSTRIR